MSSLQWDRGSSWTSCLVHTIMGRGIRYHICCLLKYILILPFFFYLSLFPYLRHAHVLSKCCPQNCPLWFLTPFLTRSWENLCSKFMCYLCFVYLLRHTVFKHRLAFLKRVERRCLRNPSNFWKWRKCKLASTHTW